MWSHAASSYFHGNFINPIFRPTTAARMRQPPFLLRFPSRDRIRLQEPTLMVFCGFLGSLPPLLPRRTVSSPFATLRNYFSNLSAVLSAVKNNISPGYAAPVYFQP
ncbi:hypothetical protein KSP39_PZI000977 [Platanthera zijinensis]|uniref:Uncharacterized protein n=1 Tax=Platanthera zijinensis TaxID=2320716 RepID=A0AAP0C1T9_9ASPA